MGLFSKYDITLSYASFKSISSFRWLGIKFVSIKFVGRNFNCFLYLKKGFWLYIISQHS